MSRPTVLVLMGGPDAEREVSLNSGKEVANALRTSGRFDVDLAREYFQGLVNHAQITVHVDNLRGDNAHHQCETIFKAFGRALRMAAEIDPRAAQSVPSTKGTL